MDIEETTSEFGDGKWSSMIDLLSMIRRALERMEKNRSAWGLDRTLRTPLETDTVADECAPARETSSMERELRVYFQRLKPLIVVEDEIDFRETRFDLRLLSISSEEPETVSSSLTHWFRNPTTTRPQVIPLKGPLTTTYRKPTSLPQRK